MENFEGSMDWIKTFYCKAVEWWGESWYDGENLAERLAKIVKYLPEEDKRILELGAGTGETAEFLCQQGIQVTAVDLCDENIRLLNQIAEKNTNLTVLQGSFYDVLLTEKFPVICLFECFGLSTDQDQRKLLKRISQEWLTEQGVVILDVYHPYSPIRNTGKKIELDRLEHIPGSVDMTEYTFYDPIKNRWIDIWEPKNDKSKAGMQSIRCYTPADLILLLEGTGLKIKCLDMNGESLDIDNSVVSPENVFEDHKHRYYYNCILEKM